MTSPVDPVTPDDEDEYVRPDGLREANWIRPHRELIDRFITDPAIRKRFHDMVDAVYKTAVEDRSAEHESMRGILAALFKEAERRD